MHNAAFASAAGLFSQILARRTFADAAQIEHQGRALLTQWEYLVLQIPNGAARNASVDWAHQAVRLAKRGHRANAARCMAHAMAYFRV
jgi:hypothetical protein